MSDRLIARRYAAALFDVAQQSGRQDRAGEELSALARLIAGHDELRTALEAPAVPARAKKDTIVAVLEAAGPVSAEVTRLMAMLAERGRLAILPDLAAAYADRLLEAKRIVRAEVVTAVPLTADHRSALVAALGKATGSEVTIAERVDPAIVGGVVARVGSVVFDGSVMRQLERLREQLATSD